MSWPTRWNPYSKAPIDRLPLVNSPPAVPPPLSIALRALLAAFLFASPSSVLARQFVVSPGGTPISIRAAIEEANAGDEIIIRGGIWREHDLVIDKPLTLTGAGDPIIDGEEAGTILTIRSDDVVIRGLTLENVGHSYTKEYAAIRVDRCRNFLLEGNNLRKVFFGILIEKSHDGIVRDNTVSSLAVNEAGSGNGIHIWHSTDLQVLDNSVSRLRDGIYLEFVDQSEIAGNTSFDNIRYGLHFMFSNHNAYHDNVFRSNGAGVAVMFSKFVTMEHNVFEKNWGSASYGLLLKEIYDAEVGHNTFHQNTIAVNIDGSTRITYRDNTFSRNGWAVKVIGACYENNFEKNDFLQNAFDVAYHGKLNDNRFNGNHWSDYTGYDLDRDGIGDVPYRPVKLFSYIVNNTPETLVLLRSLFVDIINFSEKVSPAFTPDNLLDDRPQMKRFHDSDR
ncbi:MAG: nitrous oxide reductase family maturation protein NosD [Opitutaceae bacterium]